MDAFVSRLHRVDPEIARRLVDAGLDIPAKIRAASDKELREALKGPGVTIYVSDVRKAYPKR